MDYDDLMKCFGINPKDPNYDDLVDAGISGYEEGKRLFRIGWAAENPYDNSSASHDIWKLGFAIANEEEEETQGEHEHLKETLDFVEEDFIPSSAAIEMMPGFPGLKRPLSDIPSLIQQPSIVAPQETVSEINGLFDVFISYASKDGDAVASQLAHALQKGGLKVWYDKFQLKIGDSLVDKIDQGLVKSRFNIVILSKAFLTKKGWKGYEFKGIIAKLLSKEQSLLPIWHGVTKEEIMDWSPSLTDIVARSTATHTIQQIADEIISLIKGL